jgi:hypothetical protein
MKKEFFIIFGLTLFGLAYVLDLIAGPITITLSRSDPFSFLGGSYWGNYPLTTVAILTRAFGFFILSTCLFSLIKNQFFLKAGACLLIGVIANLYAIQQIATGARTTPLPWTLSIAYAGASLTLLIIYFIIRGILLFLKQKINGDYYPEEENSKDSASQ